uniref:ParA family protein n=1 Tax=[Lactobacillus] rogosae TaxID=706562 RepID=UPI00402A81C5
MARIIAICNQKGGIGKTTTAVSLATGLARFGKKTLLIDTDAQCNSTDTYRAVTKDTATLYDLLLENEDLEECIQHTHSGDIIASDKLLTSAEQKFPQDPSRYFLMKQKCQALEDMYDYIIIDTPPVLGVILSNVLTYANECIIPFTCDRYAIQGVNELLHTINSVKSYTNKDLVVSGIVICKYHNNYKNHRNVAAELPIIAEKLNTKVFDTKIRESVACTNSQVQRMSIFDFDSKSTTAKDYMEFCKEIMN